MRQLRVIHLISALPYGGVETNLHRVLPLLQGDEFKISIVTMREKGDMAPQLEAVGIPVELIYQRTRYSPTSLWQLSRYFKNEQVDIVHCHMRRANTSGRIAAILAGVPIRIATEHDMILGKNWRHHLVDRLLSRYTDAVLGVTKAVNEINHRHAGIPREIMRVMYLGLELDRFAATPPQTKARRTLGIDLDCNEPVVGFIGRLHAIKNVDQLIRAMAEPILRDKKCRLFIVGDGPCRADLEALTDQLSLQERVFFAGFRDDLPTCYAALDCLVLPSSSEGIATVQMEAMACSVPLVTTPVGFSAEVQTAGKEYIEVDSPTPDLLAKGIAEALNPTRAASLRQAGLESISQFSIQSQANWLRDLYLEYATKHELV